MGAAVAATAPVDATALRGGVAIASIGDAVDLFATFSDERKRRSEIFLLQPIEIAPGETILEPAHIEQLLVLR